MFFLLDNFVKEACSCITDLKVATNLTMSRSLKMLNELNYFMDLTYAAFSELEYGLEFLQLQRLIIEQVKQRLVVGSVVDLLKHCAHNQHGLGSKPTHAILLCPWERHFTALSLAWWSWKAVLNFSHISIKLQPDSNILASPEVGWGDCLPYVLVPPLLSCESGG